MRSEPCTCPKCLAGGRTQLPLIEVSDLPDPDFYFGRYFKRLLKVSPPAKKAANPASGVGVFCNGSSSAPIDKGGISSGVKS